MLKMICFADAHIYDETTLDHVLRYLKDALEEHKPDIIISLGDLFDCGEICAKLGGEFRKKAIDLHPDWIFVYGNHDGSAMSGGMGESNWSIFSKIFGLPQTVVRKHRACLISLADCEKTSDWKNFARNRITPGTILLTHCPCCQDFLDEAEHLGVRLILNGHMHIYHLQKGADGQLEQLNLPPLRFGGNNCEPGGYAVIKTDGKDFTFQWVPLQPPPLPCNATLSELPVKTRSTLEASAHFPDEPDKWLNVPQIKDCEREWIGGIGRLQYRKSGKVIWDKSYGNSAGNECPSILVRYAGREYLLAAGRWVKNAGEKCYRSLVVVDPETGKESYYVKVIGLSAVPTVVDGIIYITGQWREVIAVELRTGRELWRQRSQVETGLTKELSWFDARLGGGWSVCSPAVGQHVWAVNSRGDLFGYERNTGEEKFIYPGIIPLNPLMTCPFAPLQACAPAEYTAKTNSGAESLFGFNGCYVNDTTGALL